MKSSTEQITINVNRQALFQFLADPNNLPKWAVGFCRAIRQDRDRWLVQTPRGEVAVRYVTDSDLGIIDFHISPGPGAEMVAFSRVLPNGDGSEYVFTQFQPPGMSDSEFDAQVRALKEELVLLRALINARATCPA